MDSSEMNSNEARAAQNIEKMGIAQGRGEAPAAQKNSRIGAGNNKEKLRFAQVGLLLSLLVLVGAGAAATYAWFTSNAVVNTNSVAVHSDDSQLVIELGDATANTWTQQGDAAFSSNSPDPLTLYPVSTYNLDGFAECTRTNDAGEAVHFEQAEDGQHYYHGWIDLRARMVGAGAAKATGVVNLYLGDTLAPAGADPELLKATRVGLKFSRAGQVESSYYFELDSTSGSSRAEHPATRPSLPNYTDGMLLGWENGTLTCGDDNVQNAQAYTMEQGDAATRPQRALVALEPDETYRLDVYYYIEGTDLDSADYLYGDTGILHVNLFATLDGRGA